MKLLIDENISYRILKLIELHFPGSIHVSAIRQDRLKDIDIWKYAKDNNFIIVTNDEDFYEWQLLRGFPPKVVWLRFGNSKTKLVASKLIARKDQIDRLDKDAEIGLLEIH